MEIIRICPVTRETEEQVKALHVGPGQEHFIETVEECLTEAHELSLWRPVALWHGDDLIGFAMYGRFPYEGGRVWLDRLLIDWKYQHKGLGEPAFLALLSRLQEEYGCDKIYLSLYPDNQVAMRLYKKHGFAPNGEKDINGETVMVLDCARPDGKNREKSSLS